jgi:hypothetical protein
MSLKTKTLIKLLILKKFPKMEELHIYYQIKNKLLYLKSTITFMQFKTNVPIKKKMY